jgi:hypothetical protein
MTKPAKPLTPDCPFCSFRADPCPVRSAPPKPNACKYFAHRSLGAESKDYHRRQMINDGLIQETLL